MHVRVAWLLLLTAAVAAANDGPRIDELVRGEVARQRIPGLAVGVVRNGEVIRAHGYGEANLEHGVPVTPDTIFQSGSVGKQFTAAAVMLLVEDGKVSLSDPLTTYFADAPPLWRTITVRHLMTHTSGLPEYTDGTVDLRRDYTEEEMLRFAYGLTLEFPPGARWNYSNTGYVLLGILIRKATGQFYGDVLRDRIFQPLGMKTARVISEADIVPNRAAGYRLVRGEVKNQDWVAPTLNTTADGALYLSLRDMLQWDKGLREKRVVREETWRQMLTPVSLNSGRPYPYGFGWTVEPVAGHPYVPAGFFPDTAKRYAQLLTDGGAVQHLTLLEVRDLGDDRIYTYDVTLARAALRLRAGFAPDGRLVALTLRRRPE